MARTQKSTALYAHPFSKAYWRDAAAELKDTKMLVFAALMIALRVALKLVAIPLAPSLKINTAFLANALGAMVFGPVMAIPAAIVSDLLGVIITGDIGTYFPPMVLTEVAGSLIFALFLYRAKVSPTRTMLSRFCICFFVNVLLQTPLMMWYYQVYYGSTSYVLTIPSILKNLFMFPVESVVLTLFLRFIQPITYRMKLTWSAPTELKFEKKQIALLVTLVVLGAGCVTGYLFYHYDNTSITTGYSTEEVPKMNKLLHTIVTDRTGSVDKDNTVAVIEYAEKPFLGDKITYTVAIYEVKEGCDFTEDLWSLKKTPASKHESLSKLATATVVTDTKTETVISYEIVFVR